MPVSYNHLLRRRASYDRDQVIPACQPCNSALGARALFTIAARADYLATRLAKKAARQLAAPVWETEDPDYQGMSGRLRQYVAGQQLKRRITERRLNHLQAIATAEDLTPRQVWNAKTGRR